MAVRTRKSYSSTFKSDAVRLVQTMGRSKAARHLGVSDLWTSGNLATENAEFVKVKIYDSQATPITA